MDQESPDLDLTDFNRVKETHSHSLTLVTIFADISLIPQMIRCGCASDQPCETGRRGCFTARKRRRRLVYCMFNAGVPAKPISMYFPYMNMQQGQIRLSIGLLGRTPVTTVTQVYLLTTMYVFWTGKIQGKCHQLLKILIINYMYAVSVSVTV